MNLKKRDLLKGVLASAAAVAIPKLIDQGVSAASGFVEPPPPKRIDAAIQEITNTIVEQRQKIGPKTLFVVLGEAHSHPAYPMARRGVVEALLDRGYKVAYGAELPYNLLLDERDKLRLMTRRENYDRLNEKDKDGIARMFRCDQSGLLSLAQINKDLSRQQSVAANRILDRFLFERRIPYRNNDADRQNLQLIGDDRLLHQIAEKFHRTVGSANFTAVEPAAVYYSNIVMAWNAVRHAQEVKPDIYIQYCGNLHVAGQGQKYPDAESLIGCLSEDGQAVIGYAAKEYESAALKAAGRQFTYPDLPDRSFYYQNLDVAAVTSLLKQEIDYIKAMTGKVYETNGTLSLSQQDMQALSASCQRPTALSRVFTPLLIQ